MTLLIFFVPFVIFVVDIFYIERGHN